MHFRKSPDQLDVQEANFSFILVLMQVYTWTVFPLLLFGIRCSKYVMPFRTRLNNPQEELRGDSLQATKPNTHNFIQFKHTNVIPTDIDHIPSNTIHSGAGAMLYVFEDNEAVIKMIIKGRSPTMSMFHGPTELLWIGCLTESIWTPKSKSASSFCSILAISALFAAPKKSA